MPDLIKISPSDLTFLWDECPRCFWRKYRLGVRRPFGIMPGIFSRIDSALKTPVRTPTVAYDKARRKVR